jgi:hypothetical protein
MRGILIVDVQNDFCPDGRLAVPDGDAVVPVINELTGRYGLRLRRGEGLASSWHKSFASSNPGRKEFEMGVASRPAVQEGRESTLGRESTAEYVDGKAVATRRDRFPEEVERIDLLAHVVARPDGGDVDAFE